LLGTFNGDPTDDLTTPECTIVSAPYPANANEQLRIFSEFGERWRVDGVRHTTLFQTAHMPLYDPLSFANPVFTPIFDPWQPTNTSFWQLLVFSPEEVRVSNCWTNSVIITYFVFVMHSW
jgi:hypothetical protein